MALPTTIDRYEILGELGRGGMALVHRARHVTLDRIVALKEMRLLDGGSPAATKRFLREARLGARIHHPNVAEIFDCFEVDGVPYIAMEFVPCGSLRDVPGPLSVEQVLGVARDVLAGLDAAERLGVVHRDLKPENLLVTDAGGVKIADFGIATAIHDEELDTRLTATGFTVGTPQYMAPEQAVAGAVGPWTDLYALGVVIFELLTGAVPFADARTPVEVLLRREKEPPPDPLALRPDLDPSLARWVRSLLAVAPADRPQSAVAAWSALEPVAVALAGPDWAARTSLLKRAPELAPDEESEYVTYHEPALPVPGDAPDQVTPEPSAPALPAARAGESKDVGPHPDVIPHAAVQVSLVMGETGAELTVEAGGTVEAQLRVRNDGEETATFEVRVEGIPASWWTAEPSRLHLNPWHAAEGYEAVATVRLAPPRTPEARAGRREIELHAARCDSAAARVDESVPVALTILPYAAFAACVRPQEVAGFRRGRLAVEIANEGNDDSDIELELRDRRDACTVRHERRTSIRSGERQRVECEVRARRVIWIGRPLVHAIAVAVKSRGTADTGLAASFRQRALLPWWLAVVLALAAAGAAAALLAGDGSTPGPDPRPGPDTAGTVTPMPTATVTATAVATVRVPNAVGSSLAQARTLLQGRDLDVGRVKPADFPESSPVARQDPPAGREVEPQTAVDLVLRSVKVPDLRGLTRAEAEQRLEELDLGDAVATPWDAGVDATVEDQIPPPGERVPPGEDLRLTMAAAPEPAFTTADAREIADDYATFLVGSGGDADPATCEPTGTGAFSCDVWLWSSADGTGLDCTVSLEVRPTDNFTTYATAAGRNAEVREIDDDCTSGGTP